MLSVERRHVDRFSLFLEYRLRELGEMWFHLLRCRRLVSLGISIRCSSRYVKLAGSCLEFRVKVSARKSVTEI